MENKNIHRRFNRMHFLLEWYKVLNKLQWSIKCGFTGSLLRTLLDLKTNWNLQVILGEILLFIILTIELWTQTFTLQLFH